MKVMIVVTHLLGTGHLARALVLGRAFGAVGHDVTLVSGGMPAPHLACDTLHFVQLPPLRSDGVNFTSLLDETGVPASEALKISRENQLCATLAQVRPDVLITELFPFGRRVLSDEFKALLHAADAQKPRPLICTSVRDILAPPSKPAKADATRELVAQYYSAVLVHSDPAVTPLEASWPVTPDLQAKLHYTGFVAAASAGRKATGLPEKTVIVSSGGGQVKTPVFETALRVAAQSPDLNWLLLTADPDTAHHLALGDVPRNIMIKPATPDFRHMLYDAAASVSLCGYNTALDILQAGTPAVFVPFDEGGEVEQTLRAQALSKLDGVAMIEAVQLTPDLLLRDLRALMALPRRAPVSHGLNGATETVKIVKSLVDALET